jgi:hypothetical protein
LYGADQTRLRASSNGIGSLGESVMAEPLEQQVHNLTHAVGECILAWSQVERGICLMYCELIGHGPGARTFSMHAAIFDSVISIDARLDMIETAIFQRIGTIVPVWNKLRNKVRDGYDRRNQMAHSDIIQSGLKGKPVAVRILSFPTFTNGNSPNKALFDLRQIRERREKFEQLSGEVIKVTRRLLEALAPPPGSS